MSAGRRRNVVTAGALGALGGLIWLIGLVANAVDHLGDPTAGAGERIGWWLAAMVPWSAIVLGIVMVRTPAAVARWQPPACFGLLAVVSGALGWGTWSGTVHPSWAGATIAATLLLLAAAFPDPRAELDDVLRGRRLGWALGGVMGAVVGVCVAWRWLPALGPTTAALGPIGVWLAIPAGALVGVAAVSGRRLLAMVAAVGFLVVSWPTEPLRGFAEGRCRTDPDVVVDLRVLASNVLVDTRRGDAVVDLVAERSPDVVVLSEVHPDLAADLDTRLPEHPHRLIVPSTAPDGLALYSRWPLAESVVGPMIGNDRVAATVQSPDGDVRIHGVHITTPVSQDAVDVWQADFEHLVGVVRGERQPAVVVGDFNATTANVELRRFADDAGLRRAHRGCGWRPTWPVGGGLPPLFDLDHTFVRGPIAVVGVDDGELPGSDHRWIEADLSIRTG